MRNFVTPQRHIILRLQNGMYKLVQVTPNTVINIPKYGAFSSNLLLGRPYYVTYEFLDITSLDSKKSTTLRPVPAAELHAEILGNDVATPSESRDDTAVATPSGDSEGIDIVDDDGNVLVKNNRLTIDDPNRQQLTAEEIEALKKANSGSGKEIIERIMAAHSALGEKTSFSLAKYTLRKTKKYMRRFTVLPVDVGNLCKIWTEKEPSRIMEIREEGLGLLGSWGNVHWHTKGGKYLVVDDASGLVTAMVAERLGVLYPEVDDEESESEDVQHAGAEAKDVEMKDATKESPRPPSDVLKDASPEATHAATTDHTKSNTTPKKGGPYPHNKPIQSSAESNTITLLHAATQPNISMLEPFGYDADHPDPQHPLYVHLRTITWLQLLSPKDDAMYQEPLPPEPANEEEAKLPLQQRIAAMNSGKRSAYWKKRKRWERVKNIVDSTRAGGFDSIIIASTMDPISMLPHLVPLLRGGGNLAIYSPTIESLTKVMDLYSRDRRTAYTKFLQQSLEGGLSRDQAEKQIDKGDFPVDPTLLLNPMLQTSRAREWQVLPMRTHPVMTGRGGAEGYIFSGTRVLPVKGVKVEAKGVFGKKRKVEAEGKGKVGE